MSALRKPEFDSQYYSPQSQLPDRRPLDKSAPSTVRKVVKRRSFPQQNQLPQNLKLLSAIQKTSFGIAVASMLASTGLYISTVQIPRLWSQEYRNLEDLQLQERQLIAINEKIKYQIAQEAAKDNRLSISQPDSAVFISPAKVDAKIPSDTNSRNQELVKIKYNNLGY